MSKKRLALGLDSSTQSLTAVVLDIDAAAVVLEHSLSYRADARLNGFGFDHDEMIVPPREPGEADQPPRLFLASLDAMFADLKTKLASVGASLSDVVSVNTSGQQHGHVYLGAAADQAFAGLKGGQGGALVERLGSVFSYGTAPIWKTANTGEEAAEIRKGAGGAKKMVALSGSDSPLRFTGAVVRRVGKRYPERYAATKRILLISNLIPAVLAGDPAVGIDFGNGAGMSLMNYRARQWDAVLLKAATKGLPGGAAGLAAKLGPVVHPLATVGSVAGYFVERYGFSPECAVVAGSGDNPQTKVLIDGDLLSLGTSFVMMAATAEGTVDPRGWANAMYDGLGRPFCFGCRTNGALVWERVRGLHGVGKDDFAACDAALAAVKPGSALRWWQPDRESFPLSAAAEFTRRDALPADFDHDYAGAVDSSLGLLYQYSRSFAGGQADTLYLSGGPTANKFIVARIAAIWNCPVVVIGKAGAALGTAVAAAAAVSPEARRAETVKTLCQAVLGGARAVLPDPAAAAAYHGPDGYLARLEKEFAPLLQK